MSASDTERRAYFIASSKCARVMQGTGSIGLDGLRGRLGFGLGRGGGSVGVRLHGRAAAAAAAAAAASARSLSMSFSIDSRIAYLHARWQISVMSAPEKPVVVC